MTNIDQFESVFRAANKERFALQSFTLDQILVVTDLPRADSNEIAAEAKTLLSQVLAPRTTSWTICGADNYASVDALVARIADATPDLICTYRNLKTPATAYPYSLGTYLDVMTQATDVPVLVLPRPEMPQRNVPDNTDSVMVITDHLTGDHRLVSVAVHLTQPGGTLRLTHIEDEARYRRFVEIISKIPSLNTATAEQALRDQLLKEPKDYIQSIVDILQTLGLDLKVQPIVATGNHLRDYRSFVEQHRVDLLVMNTKDEDQLAMHGLAYPLAVELRNTPMLLL